MSRIGKQPIVVPASVTVTIDGQTVKVKGPKGELQHTFPAGVTIVQENGQVQVTRASDAPSVRAAHGLTRALINNMVVGVTDGWQKTLQLEGVGYRAEMAGKDLNMALGFSHPVVINPPDGISFDVDPRARQVMVRGIDRELVGQVAANIRGLRPAEPYKGKGFRYLGEQIKRKAGKAGKVGKK